MLATGFHLECALIVLSFCLFVFLSFCLFAFVSFCLFVFLSFCPFVFLSFCLFVFLFFCFFVFLSFWFFCLFVLSGRRLTKGRCMYRAAKTKLQLSLTLSSNSFLKTTLQ